MSSRNERLTATQRDAAKIIHETLLKVEDWFRIITIPEINNRVKEIFESEKGMVMEYFKIAGTVRASFAVYNTFEEIDILAEGIRKAQKMLT